MKKTENKEASWAICQECQGRGKKSRGLSKKALRHYQIAFELFEKTNSEGAVLVRPKGHLYSCLNCFGSGLVGSANTPVADKENFPHVAIIGAGI